MFNCDNDDMVPHFVYCFGNYSGQILYYKVLKNMILSNMEKYGMQSSILTGLKMSRRNLITKEKSKAAYEGKLKNEDFWKDYEGSINDDLESFFNNLHEISSLDDITEESVSSFFLPKLTAEELQLVEDKDKGEMLSYLLGDYADVDEKEMQESDSTDKYLKAQCERETIILNLDETSRCNFPYCNIS